MEIKKELTSEQKLWILEHLKATDEDNSVSIWGEKYYSESAVLQLIKEFNSLQPVNECVKEEKPKKKARNSFKICAGCGGFAHGNPGHDLI